MANRPQSMNRIIVKQGYLKKMPNAAKMGASFKRPDERWFVFGVINQREPYLEYYESEQGIFTSPPINFISLKSCRHINRSLTNSRHSNMFTLVLLERELALIAPSRHQMLEWVRALERRLKDIGIIQDGTGENIYEIDKSKFKRHSIAASAGPNLRLTLPERPASITRRPVPAPPFRSRPRVPTPPPADDINNNPAEGLLISFDDIATENTASDNTDTAPVVPPVYFSTSHEQVLDGLETAVNDLSILDTADDNQGVSLDETVSDVYAISRNSSAFRNSVLNSSNNLSSAEIIDPPEDLLASLIDTSVDESEDNSITVADDLVSVSDNMANERLVNAEAPPAQSEELYGALWNNSGATAASNQSRTSQYSLPPLPGSRSPGSGASGGARTPEIPSVRSNPGGQSPGGATPATPTSPMSPPSYTPQAMFTPPRPPPPVDTPVSPISPLMPPFYTPTDSLQSPAGRSYVRPVGSAELPEPEVCNDPLPFSLLPTKMQEALGGNNDTQAPSVGGWNLPPGEEGAPPAYSARGVLNRGAQRSLKHSQVELLRKEMDHPGGVKIVLRRIDCHRTLALVDCFGAVWIAGWNQQARPFLHNAFHLGDQLLSINGQVIENVRMARKLIKHCSETDKITVIVKRVPHAKVFAIRREEEGQALGIRREGITAEIIDVDPFGIAAQAGLPTKAPSLDGTNLCNWMLTEVNHRPLNFFFKADEIDKRLNAVGKDISIMVQPSQFVNEIKKQLKLVKYYKDYIVQ